MEEERLILIKEHKESKDAFDALTKEKASLSEANSALSLEVESLRKTVEECDKLTKSLKDELDQQREKLARKPVA